MVKVGESRAILMKRLDDDRKFYTALIKENEKLTKELQSESVSLNASSFYWLDKYRQHYMKLVYCYNYAVKQEWVLPYEVRKLIGKFGLPHLTAGK